MKKTIVCFILSIFALMALAQNQKGLVKTKGRLDNNGNVIKGRPLSNAMVSVKGGNVALSGLDGMFMFALSGKSYSLQSVQKMGMFL